MSHFYVTKCDVYSCFNNLTTIILNNTIFETDIFLGSYMVCRNFGNSTLEHLPAIAFWKMAIFEKSDIVGTDKQANGQMDKLTKFHP